MFKTFQSFAVVVLFAFFLAACGAQPDLDEEAVVIDDPQDQNEGNEDVTTVTVEQNCADKKSSGSFSTPDALSDVSNATMLQWYEGKWNFNAFNGSSTSQTVDDAERGEVMKVHIPEQNLDAYQAELQYEESDVDRCETRKFAGWLKSTVKCHPTIIAEDSEYRHNGLYAGITLEANQWTYFEMSYVLAATTTTHRAYIQVGFCEGADLLADDLYDGPGNPIPY